MQKALVLWRIHLHLAAFAQLGVLARIIIGRLFSGPCSGYGRWSWAPCVTGSGMLVTGDTLFYDFPANVLGSFLIGLFSTGANLAALYTRQCATINITGIQLPFLPHGSLLQHHSEFHLGLRTGFCGSLTTFSSWYMQVVTLMVGRAKALGTVHGTHWVQALTAIYLGMCGPLLGLVVGQHTALESAAFWSHPPKFLPGSPDGRRPEKQQQKQQQQQERDEVGLLVANAGPANTGAGPGAALSIDGGLGEVGNTTAAVMEEAAAPSPSPCFTVLIGLVEAGARSVVPEHIIDAGLGPAAAACPHPASAASAATALVLSSLLEGPDAESLPQASRSRQRPHDHHPPSASSSTAPQRCSPRCGQPAPSFGSHQRSPSLESQQPAGSQHLPDRRVLPPAQGLLAIMSVRSDLLVDAAAAAVLLILTGVSLSYAYLDNTTHSTTTDRQFWWFAILLGPPGCFIRWYLSHLNGCRLRRRAADTGGGNSNAGGSDVGGSGDGVLWLQVGTWSANLLGCALVFTAEALMFRLAGSLRGVQVVALQGLMVGTAGCLTTVSTYVVEIQRLALDSTSAAYKYFLASTLAPVVLGLLVYGIPVWQGTR